METGRHPTHVAGHCIAMRDSLSVCCAAASLSWVEHKEGAGGTPQGSGLSLTACGQHGLVAFGGSTRAPHNQLYCLDPAAAAWQRWKPSGVRLTFHLPVRVLTTLDDFQGSADSDGSHAAQLKSTPLARLPHPRGHAACGLCDRTLVLQCTMRYICSRAAVSRALLPYRTCGAPCAAAPVRTFRAYRRVGRRRPADRIRRQRRRGRPRVGFACVGADAGQPPLGAPALRRRSAGAACRPRRRHAAPGRDARFRRPQPPGDVSRQHLRAAACVHQRTTSCRGMMVCMLGFGSSSAGPLVCSKWKYVCVENL